MRIFISYKREGGIDIAARVRDYFTQKGYEVFYDINSMQIGNFEDQIEKSIQSCDYFILIVTSGALESVWVQKEIRTELQKENPHIIPVMMPDFVSPSNLPEDISKVLSFHGITYSAVLFDQVMDKLYELMSESGLSYKTILDEILNLLGQTIDLMEVLYVNDGKILERFNKMSELYEKLAFLSYGIKDKYEDLYKQITVSQEFWKAFVERYERYKEEQTAENRQAISNAIVAFAGNNMASYQTALNARQKIK